MLSVKELIGLEIEEVIAKLEAEELEYTYEEETEETIGSLLVGDYYKDGSLEFDVEDGVIESGCELYWE